MDIDFARGSGESPGLGITGTPFVNSLRQNLTGKSVSSYAVNYAADVAQTSAGPGATDMTRHVVSVAASCPNTTFLLGGYSQGASVTDISIGIPTARPSPPPGYAHRADGTTPGDTRRSIRDAGAGRAPTRQTGRPRIPPAPLRPSLAPPGTARLRRTRSHSRPPAAHAAPRAFRRRHSPGATSWRRGAISRRCAVNTDGKPSPRTRVRPPLGSNTGTFGEHPWGRC
ncbi:cutinase family protein [Frankia sp. Cpl3]|nr:cutinase family protein [Frankia sp. Cpl3]